VRVTLTIDGTLRTVEVDLDASTVRIDGVTHAVKVLSATGERAELEIDGEPVTIEGWPEGLPQPLRDLAVNGERVTAKVEAVGPEGPAGPKPPNALTESATGAVPAAPAASEPSGPGVTVRPPMPGKVLEVRVRDGETVASGQVLLVLEAMKMRNDVLAPAAGTVRDLRAVAGANVRAREPLLRIELAAG